MFSGQPEHKRWPDNLYHSSLKGFYQARFRAMPCSGVGSQSSAYLAGSQS